ncbi:MAG: hypothetical protein JWP91_575 [Fibrobacteres bacterium]|nr:hypothetical protein [Fibrobacterota bacterium]
MCYAYKPVKDETGRIWKVPHREFQLLVRDGLIVPDWDGYHYAKDRVAAILVQDKEYKVLPMRWDLVPRHFFPELPLAEMIKRKNSRAKDSKGFPAWNARSETVAELYSFRTSWGEGMRMAVPAAAFRERPNMDGAPKEFTGREYDIRLKGIHYLGGIWAHWENKAGERLDSCSIVTVDSLGNGLLRGIWHERCPLILTEAEAEEWLDPATTPRRALEMCRLFSADGMEKEEVVRPVKPDAQTSLLEGL